MRDKCPVRAADRNGERFEEFINGFCDLLPIPAEGIGQPIGKRLALADAVFGNLVAGKLGRVVVGQEENYVFRVCSLQAGSAKQQFSAAVMSGGWIGRAVNNLLQYEDAAGGPVKSRIIENLPEVPAMSVNVAADDEFAAGIEIYHVAFSTRVVAIAPGGVAEDICKGL